jgi:hypothetical protein
MNLPRYLLVLLPVAFLGAGLGAVACTTTTSSETPDGGGSSSGGSSSGGHSSSSGGSSSGGSSSGGSSSGGSSSGGSSSGGVADCAAIAYSPPIVVVTTAPGAACDAVFQVLDLPDASTVTAGAELCLQDADAAVPAQGCPTPDGGAPTGCTYVLTGLEFASGPYTVQVSAPDYNPTTISNVTRGEGGCVPVEAPSTSNVTLVAIDAGP